MFQRRQPNQWLLWVVPVSVLVLTTFSYGSPRFRLPAEISAIVWAAVALEQLTHFRKRRESRYDVG